MASLSSLPVELHTHIFSFLSVRDLRNVRLVNSRVSQCADPLFARSLSNVTVCIHESGLQRALKISQSRFCHAPKTLTVCGIPSSLERGAFQTQAELLDSGEAFCVISRVLQSLQRCDAVNIYGQVIHRLQLHYGLETFPHALDTYIRSRTVSVVLAAMDHCQRKFDSIEIQFGETEPPMLELPGMRIASQSLYQLRHLRIQVRVSERPRCQELRRLAHFLGSFPLLCALSLEFVTELDGYSLQFILDRLSFPRLNRLELGNASITTGNLLGFLRRHMTTKELYLDDIRLSGSLLEWKTVLTVLKDEFTLSTLRLRWCLSGKDGFLLTSNAGCCIEIRGLSFREQLATFIDEQLAYAGSASEAQVRQLVTDLAIASSGITRL